MKKRATLLFLSLLLAGVTGAVRAQDLYHPITDGCSWSVSNEKYMTAGDTVLDGKTYLKLYRQVGSQPFEFNLQDAEFFAAIRDDSAERKVYAYLPAGTWVYDQFNQLNIIDTGMDALLYDFAPELGETLLYYTICPAFHAAQEIFAYRSETAYVTEGYENEIAHYTVYEDSDSLIMMSDGSTRRRILLSITWGVDYWSEVWIEGIGRLEGFNDPGGFETENPLKMMLCYSDSTGAFYRTGYDFDGSDDCFNDCSYGPGGIPDNVLGNLSVYPNPAGDLLHIELSGVVGIASVALYDLQGRMVTGAGAHAGTPQQGGTATVNLRNVPAGVYLLRVRDAEGKEYMRKIVKK